MHHISKKRKNRVFENCEKAYGQPALMFSGGATLGLFHTGVCKALIEQDLMPKVLSGSSAGAIMTGMLGTSASEDIQNLLNGEQFLVMLFILGNSVNLLKAMVELPMFNI